MTDEEEKLIDEIFRLQKRAERWKIAAKVYRERFNNLSDNMDEIINDIIDDDPPVTFEVVRIH